MDSLTHIIRGLGVAMVGAVLGIVTSQLVDYYRSRPLALINANVQQVSQQVVSGNQALQQELARLRSLTAGQPELDEVIARIDTISHGLSADLRQVSYFSEAIESNFLWLAERERQAQLNSLPDFILPLNKGASLCGDGITFSVLAELEQRIETRLAGRRIHFDVGDERIFEIDGERAKLAYLGRSEHYFQFRLLCSLA